MKSWVWIDDKIEFFFSEPRPVPWPVAIKNFWFFCRNGCILHWWVILSLETLFENHSEKKYSIFCEYLLLIFVFRLCSEISPGPPFLDRPREIIVQGYWDKVLHDSYLRFFKNFIWFRCGTVWSRVTKNSKKITFSNIDFSVVKKNIIVKLLHNVDLTVAQLSSHFLCSDLP